nr:DMT family transporter [Galactobacter caseinivorans]
MSTPARTRGAAGLWWGALGILAFSFTVPLTRVAVGAGLPALFVGAGRAVVAAVLAAILLAILRPARPRGRQWLSLAVVAFGVVLGFPLLTSYALASVPASHAATVIAVVPAVTAVFACLRTGERPKARFWIFAALGSLAGVLFAAIQGGGLGGLHAADLLLFGAVIAVAIGYAEGGVLSKTLGSWQTISWALIISLPATTALTGFSAVGQDVQASFIGWLCFAYLAVVSMFLGFFAWYRGLAIGPMVRVSQVQLMQPLLSIVWAAWFLAEALTWATVLGGLVVVLFAWLAVRSRR